MKGLEDDYQKWLLSDGFAESSISYQRSRLREFMVFCEDNNIALETIDVDVSRAYLTMLAQRRNKQKQDELLSSSARAKHFDFLKKFGYFLKEKTIISNPEITTGIRRPQPRKTTIQSFSEMQLEVIMNEATNLGATVRYQERAALLIYTLVSTGLRISELLPLKPVSFDFDSRNVLVIGKGNKERNVPFSFELSFLLQEYIDKYNIDRDGYIFASRYGKPLAASSVRDILRTIKKSIGAKYGIDRMRVSPHTFRHTFARLWVVKGGNTIALSRILGHTSTQMTDNYVRLWGVDLNQAYDTCSPFSNISIPKIKR